MSGGEGACWERGPSSVRAEAFSGLDSLGVVHAFALRQPHLDLATEREKAMRRLIPAHAALREELGLGARRFCTAEQVHGAGIAVVDAGSPLTQAGVDGLLTEDPGVCLGIYTADCCAVFLVDPVRRVVGLLHSGSKSTRLGITRLAIEGMVSVFGSKPRDLVAVLSPCIRPPLYEVDFAAEIRQQCEQAGVGRVFDAGVCTGRDLGKYYSYRVEQGKTGRMLALLALGEDGSHRGQGSGAGGLISCQK